MSVSDELNKNKLKESGDKNDLKEANTQKFIVDEQTNF